MIRLSIFGMGNNTMKLPQKFFMKLDDFIQITVDGSAKT
jgi:hypothetical protein